MLAVYKRDLKSYFNSMIGCVYIAFIIAFVSIYFAYYNLRMGYPYFGDVMCSVAYILMLALPILTMRSFAEERKSKTDQILYTSKSSVTGIVIGKYLAMATIYLIPILWFCVFPLIISAFGTHDFKGDYSCILIVFLIGCAYIALGMFLSSLTESPIIAAVMTFGILLILQLMSGITNFISTSNLTSFIGCVIVVLIAAFIYYAIARNAFVTAIISIVGVMALIVTYIVKSSVFGNFIPTLLNKLPLTNTLDNFAIHTFDVSGVVYCISFGLLFIFLTVQSIQKRRYS